VAPEATLQWLRFQIQGCPAREHIIGLVQFSGENYRIWDKAEPSFLFVLDSFFYKIPVHLGSNSADCLFATCVILPWFRSRLHFLGTSTCGADYCRKVSALHGLSELFEGFTAKPDIVIDDMPSTCVSPFVYSVQQEAAWPKLAERIIQKHVD